MQLVDLMKHGERLMAVCNACRYCEGFCAVFPAMERRHSFSNGDLNYLANLCHNCGECYYACPYSPPHQFDVNVPQTLAKIRRASYEQYAWPRALSSAFARNGLVVSLMAFVILTAALTGSSLLLGGRLFEVSPAGNFYKVIPHEVMAWTFGASGGLMLLPLLVGVLRAWRDSGESLREFFRPFALWQATKDVLNLTYLHGGGAGCAYPTEQHSPVRRWFHHFTFYGFMLCFAATSVAAVYHYGFGWKAPYGYLSLPVILGTVGGIGLTIGPTGFLWLKMRRDPEPQDADQLGMDVAFIVLLLSIAVTGLMLLALRQTAAMGMTLIVHLALVMTLFLMLPYGKFVHSLYRCAALVKYALERSRHP